MLLKDKIVIVTGGSGLLGKSMVTHFRAEGATVVNFDIAKTEDKNSFECDVTKSASVRSAIDGVLSKFGRIDGLVNNAYPRTADWGAKWEDIPEDSWRSNVDMQLNSLFSISQLVSKVMTKQESGCIVNIASIYGVVGNDFTVYEGTSITGPAAYSAIKGGVVNLTRYLASYLGKFQVRVNCVSPGGVYNGQDPRFVAQYSGKVPLGRMATPDDIAPAVAFLLSDGSKYITGHNLIVDGGWTAI